MFFDPTRNGFLSITEIKEQAIQPSTKWTAYFFYTIQNVFFDPIRNGFLLNTYIKNRNMFQNAYEITSKSKLWIQNMLFWYLHHPALSNSLQYGRALCHHGPMPMCGPSGRRLRRPGLAHEEHEPFLKFQRKAKGKPWLFRFLNYFSDFQLICWILLYYC